MSGPAPAVRAGRRRGDRGAVIPIVAICLPILIIMTAFAVDLGRQRSARRTMQSRADVIALDMARLIDGSTEQQLETSGAPATMLAQSASRNGISLAQLTYEWGTWNGSAFVGTLATAVPNAVSVRAQDDVDYYFQPGTGHADRHAVATNGEPEASVWVGSFAARLPEGKNSLISLLGESLGLQPPYAQILGFEGLANSNIPVGDLLTELQLGSPEEVANADVSLEDFTLAAARVLSRSTASEDVANAELLESIAPSLPSRDIHMGELVNVDPGGNGSALDGSVNAFDFFLAAAQLSNGTSGVSVSNLALQNLNLGAIQLANVQADLNAIQAPQLVSGRTGKAGRTEQVTTSVRATLLGSGLGNLLNTAIEIDLGTAAGSAVIGEIDCADPERFQIAASAALVETVIRIRVLGVTITVRKPPGTDFDQPIFTKIDDPATVPVEFDPELFTSDDGELGLSNITTTVQPALLGLLLNPILNTLTNTVLPLLDANLLGPLTQQLGVNVGGADFDPSDIDCTAGVRLVE